MRIRKGFGRSHQTPTAIERVIEEKVPLEANQINNQGQLDRIEAKLDLLIASRFTLRGWVITCLRKLRIL
jgi:hypothetical protein